MNKASYKQFIITADYTGEKRAPWDGIDNRNHHRVTVRNTETGKRTAFDFWASIANPILESDYDILNAFYCFVSDAVSGSESFQDFCNEFGYNDDSIKALKTWKACKRAAVKLERIAPGVDLYDLVNDLSENYA